MRNGRILSANLTCCASLLLLMMMLRSSTVSDISPRLSPENMPDRQVKTISTTYWYAAGAGIAPSSPAMLGFLSVL